MYKTAKFKKKYGIYNWTIGSGFNRAQNICKFRFLKCYNIGHSYVDEILSEIRNGGVKITESLLSDRSAGLSNHPENRKFIKQIIDMASRTGFSIITRTNIDDEFT